MTDTTHADVPQEDGPEGDAPPAPRRRFRLGARMGLELVVVTLGVLIALALENLVQELRWQSEARELEQMFRDDIEFNLASAVERQAVDPCLRQQLERLGRGVTEARDGFAAAPYVTALDNPMGWVVPVAYRAPLRTWRTTSFDRALGTEAAKRIPQQRFLAYAFLFRTFSELQEMQDDEYSAVAALAPLAYGQSDFPADVRAQAQVAVSALDSIRGRLQLVSQQSIQNARDYGIAPDRATIERRRLGSGADSRTLREILEAQRQGRGACVDIDGGLNLLGGPA